MSEFLNDFLTEDAKGRPRAYLAAFGKHPGWNDHIDDLGIETESLVLAKRLVYLEGLSSQIDSGAWEKLTAEERLEGFDHLMLWRRGSGAMLGTMISSRDGKGRTRYPMILCAQFIGVPLSRALREGRPVIEAAMEACRATTSAEAVRTIVSDARQKLRSIFGEQTTAGGSGARGRPLPGEKELGPEDEGLRRILYHIRNHLAPWAPGKSGEGAEGDVHGAHLRMAQVFADVDTAILSWSDFFDTQVDPRAPRLMLWPRKDPWIDVIVGEPVGPDFFGLRANRRALPCVDDVPYEMDAEFRGQAAEVIGRLATPERRDAPSIFAAGSGSVAARERPAAETSATPDGSGRKTLVFALLGLAALGALIAVIVFLLRQPPPPVQTRPVAPAAAPAAATPAATQAPAPPAAQAFAPGASATPGADVPSVTPAEAWTVLCRDYDEWFGALEEALQNAPTRARWAADPHLKSQVLDPLEQARQALGNLDPRVIAGVPGQLHQIGGTPPAALQDPAVAEKIIAAHRAVKSIAGGLDSWPRIGGAIQEAAQLAALGWTAPLDDRPSPDPIPWTYQLVSVVEQALKAPALPASLARDAEKVIQGLQQLETVGDPDAVAAAAAARAGLIAIDRSAALQRELRLAADVLDPVLAFATGEWVSGTIARERFLGERGSEWAGGATGLALLGRWPDAARQFAIVAAEDLPLPDEAWQPRVASVQSLIGQLGQLAPGAGTETFKQRLETIVAERTTLRATPTVRAELLAREQSGRAVSESLEALSSQLAAEVGRHLDPAGWAQQIRAIHFADSAVIDADWTRRREALLNGWDPVAAKSDLGAFVEFRTGVERAEKFLRDMLAHPSLAAGGFSGSGLPADLAGELDAIARQAREGALRRMTELATPDRVARETFAEFLARPEAISIVDAHAATLKSLETTSVELAAALQRLADGAPWQDVARGGLAQAKFIGSPELEAQLARFAALGRLAASEDPAALLEAARASDWSTAITAWTQLGSLTAWPAGLADLQAAIDIGSALSARSTSEIGHLVMRTRIQEQIAASLRKGWNLAYTRAPDPDLPGVLQLAGACGVDEADLVGRQKLNSVLLRLRSLPWLSFDDARGRAEREKAAENIVAAAGDDLAWVRPLVAQLEAVSFDKPKVDYEKQGPGGADGWRIDSAVDPSRLAFMWDDFRVEFVQVEGLPQPVYLSTTEVTARLFIEWTNKLGQWAPTIEAHKLLLEDFDGGDPRRGPRTYTLGGPANGNRRFVRVDSQWLESSINRYGNGDKPGPPTERTPLNYVSFDGARLFAASLNCRLPTTGEWLGALAMHERARAGTTPANARDARWLRQFEYQKSQRDPCWPDSDIFIPATLADSVPVGAAATVAVTEDDKVLWLADVDGDAAATFRHLLGNVAEFVVGDEGSPGVMGGSALSPPELPGKEFLPVDPRDATRGFSDVGLRLAFSIEQPSATAEIQRILLAAGFLR